jgi:hypothetical protein
MESNFNNNWEEFGREPSEGLWDRIEATLDEKKKKKPLFIWFYYGLSACFIVWISGIGLFDNKQSNYTQSIFEHNQLIDTEVLSNFKKTEENNPTSNESISKEKSDISGKKPINIGNINDLNSYQFIEYRMPILISSGDSETLHEKVKDSEDTAIPSNTLPSNKDDLVIQATEKDSTVTSRNSCKKEKGKRFEFGVNYAVNMSNAHYVLNTDPNNSMPYTADLGSSTIENTMLTPGTKYYRLITPLYISLAGSYFINEYWRLDTEIGYNRINYRVYNEESKLISDGLFMSTFSFPLLISYEQRLFSSKHHLQYGTGIVNDFSFGKMNSGSELYYGLAVYARMGYAFRFGACEQWKVSGNISYRNTIYNRSNQPPPLHNKSLFGLQFGISRMI